MKKKNIESSFDSWLREEGHPGAQGTALRSEACRTAGRLDDGDSSGVAEGSVLARVREKLNLPRPR
jgi:hypothetical protein